MSFKIKFWGVRGSIATPGPNHVFFGGNTSCIELAMGGHRVILDAGTGIRNLGHWLQRKNVRFAHLLLSHTHWDHVNGFPFFSPAFHKDNEFVIRAGHLMDQGGIRGALSQQMAQPLFPVPIDIMAAKLHFEDFRAGESFTIGNTVKVRTAPLNHPNGATAYRFDYQGKSCCYVTDTEHVPGKLDQVILDLIAGADLVIYDSTYTDKEYLSHVGWGHSTWQEGVRLCQAAGVKQYAIFHHDPDHDDEFMSHLESEAHHLWSGAFVARENMRVTLA